MLRVLVDLDDCYPLYTQQATENFDLIQEKGKADAFYSLMEELFNEGVTLSEIDDYIKYSMDEIGQTLGVDFYESVKESIVGKTNKKISEALKSLNEGVEKDKTLFGTKVTDKNGKLCLIINTWVNKFADKDVDFATCVDDKGKTFNAPLDELHVEE